MRDHLVAAINAKLGTLGLKALDIQQRYGISEIDLRGIISGHGQVPLARIVMFAANLGYNIQTVVSEDA